MRPVYYRKTLGELNIQNWMKLIIQLLMVYTNSKSEAFDRPEVQECNSWGSATIASLAMSIWLQWK